MSAVLQATLGSVGLALAAVVLALPLAVATGWSAAGPGRGPAATRQALRLLGSLPLALVGLVVFAAGVRLGGVLGVLIALMLGAYAPLALAVCSARTASGRRPERDALALGLSPRAVLVTVVLPLLRAPLAAASLRVSARLVGETGVFLLFGAAGGVLPRTLGADALARAIDGGVPLELVALVVLALGLAELAARCGREVRV